MNNKKYTPALALKCEASVKRNGYFLVENVYDDLFCNTIKQFIDNQEITKNVELNYEGTEKRIWNAHLKNDLVKEFFDDSAEFSSLMSVQHSKIQTVLACKNEPLGSKYKSNQEGRWHIDSMKKMLKIFVFLTDTTESSGPFEFIPNTNGWNKLKFSLQPGFFLDIKSFIKKNVKRPYQSIDEKRINKLIKKGFKPTPVLVKKGTIMIINSAALIHRARPCESEKRYVLTSYFGNEAYDR